VWNTLIPDGSKSNELHWKVEAAESSASGCARSCNDDARELCTKSKAKLGLGAISLRLSYLAVLATTGGNQVEGCYQDDAEYIKDALQLYKQAGDWFGFQVARAHLALCLLGMYGPNSQKI
jgi:hypothetical protein